MAKLFKKRFKYNKKIKYQKIKNPNRHKLFKYKKIKNK